MKKLFSAILTLAILAVPFGIFPTAHAAETAAPDFTVAKAWPATDKENYWGPYGDADISGGTLLFDQSKTNAYITMGFKDYGADTTYKYLELTMKSDNASGDSLQLSIGQTAAGVQNGKPLTDWVLADGTKGIQLTNDYKTFRVDLAANGTTQFFVEGKPAIALNQLGTGKIYIQSIVLTGGTKITSDSQPESSAPSSSSSVSSGTPAPSADYVVGDKWAQKALNAPSENYWGPYGDFELNAKDGTLNWYADEKDSWGTIGFFFDNFDHTNGYKYLVLVAKTDDPAKCNVQMSIGQDENDKKIGKAFSDWTMSDGKTGAKLTTEYKTYAIDLKASGVAKFLVQGQPDFAFNADQNTDYMISIDKIYLTNTAPKAENTTSSSPSSASSTSSVSSQSGSPKTGESGLLIPVSAIAFGVSAFSLLYFLKIKKSKVNSTGNRE